MQTYFICSTQIHSDEKCNLDGYVGNCSAFIFPPCVVGWNSNINSYFSTLSRFIQVSQEKKVFCII